MPQQDVSLIIANLNGIEHLETLFGSIREQTFPQDRIEVVFVDNASSDGSVRWVEEHYPTARIIRNERNEGFAAACNKGAAEATNHWLAFVNNDMRLAPGWLSELAGALEDAGQSTVCAGSRILSWDGARIDFTGGVLSFYGHAFQRNFNEAVEAAEAAPGPEKTLFACGGAMLIDREVFTSVGGFDEDYFAYFEDVDLGWRLWLMGHEVIFAPAAVAYHKRFSTAGKYLGIKHLFLCERNALYTIYKNYSEEHLRAVLPAALILLVQRALLHTAGASVGLPESSVSNRTEPGKPEVATHEGGFSRILRMLRESGFRATLERARLASVLRRMRKDGIYPISQEGLSILSAIPSLTANLKKLSSKREFVQGHRKRSDAEIFSLFGEPFRPLPDNREFEELVATLSETFGLDSIFDAERTAGT